MVFSLYLSPMNAFAVLFSILITGFSLHAQGTLQFNQVKYVTSIDSVPPNKVWKVESSLLSLQLGIRVSPFFMINGDTIVLGYDSYDVSRWENVTSVDVEFRGNACGVQARMRFLGSGGGSAIDQDNVGTGFSGTYSQFTNIATFTPPSPGNNEIDRWSFWIAATSSNAAFNQSAEFRVVVNLSNGAQIVETYSLPNICSSSGCGSCGYTLGSSVRNIVASNTSTTANPRMDRVRPQISTPFPFWLPSGSTLAVGGNVGGLSVIEFNVIP